MHNKDVVRVALIIRVPEEGLSLLKDCSVEGPFKGAPNDEPFLRAMAQGLKEAGYNVVIRKQLRVIQDEEL